MSIVERLSDIQQALKCPKNQYNSFGKYNYRNCEDILDGLKKILGSASVTLTDEIVQIGERYYLKAIATFSDGKDSISTAAFAREPLTKKGMDESQITGAASSYARKYALCGLFALDDNKDADSQDNRKAHEDKAYTEQQKTIFDEAITNKNALSLWALKGVISETAYQGLFSSFEPGKITQNKAIFRTLESGGFDAWEKLITDFNDMIEREDAMGLAQQVAEFKPHEKKYLSNKIGEENTQKLKQLLDGGQNNEPE